MSTGVGRETLEMVIGALVGYAKEHLTDRRLIELDQKDLFPLDEIRAMCGPELGLQLFFVPEEHGGMGASSLEIYRLCEEMGRIDIGVATGLFATFLGSEPISVGGTPEQKSKWLGQIAENGTMMAYGATEPAAGSDLGALRTIAEPVLEDGKVVAYKINGNKQWISNGGFADVVTILARTPGGPSWFVVERGTPGFTAGKPEEKHGIRLSNTAALTLDDVVVGVDRLVGNVEGQGLVQAQAVFGYTRLMVAAFGLGGGWAALDRAIRYSTERAQAGSPLSQKQGYTHKLIVPHAVRLEGARAYVEQTALQIDNSGGAILNTEGAIAKLLATEAGNAAADAAIQALGGYGYTHEYMVEKIKRDVRITTIYEGTSEIMEMTIARDRWQLHLKTRGEHYHALARQAEALHRRHADVGAATAALAMHALAAMLEQCRLGKLTRHQHILFRLGTFIAKAEGALAMVDRAAGARDHTLDDRQHRRFGPDALAAIARVHARDVALEVALEGLRWVRGANGVTDAELPAFEAGLNLGAIQRAQEGLLDDMGLVADALYAAYK